ncbi:Copper amine oxidase N-terminal domain-containing protein [Proteiniborus ethanoligenes]|uniref:Copper amine oxidase N-terminal domain-containing protein n=1 Tax=Proteiniborus ethanoligenes TaxID=415015 RepID=A0A1H3QCA6_9FIRM|nr:copper amine oxidase N-terminal domain-containing protein [Proteiniborus ethanoligenes]TAH63308.1 MAG: copper amine oxidase N-terminal domain-containing protein [Gottschalkiaceae bacterium]SDZ10665.1 Copper amine oxidase N-terminal domain-containing protein [Proteiniborus ethanoligenes]
MKRRVKMIGTLTLALVMASPLTPIYASTAEETNFLVRDHIALEEISNLKDEKMNYLSYEGVVKEIRTNGVYLSVSLENEGEITAVFNIFDDTPIVDQASKEALKGPELKNGQKIIGYYRKDMPMLMIYPPMISPDLVIVKDQEDKDFIKYSYFNEELVSEDNFLKLNVSDETIITDQYGEKLGVEDLYNKDLVVFYSATTKSIPAQTNPSKIIILSKKSSESSEFIDIDEVIKAESYKEDGITMIPLRKIAEALEYKVEWNNESRSVLLTRGNSSFTISIGQEKFGYNKSIGVFEKAPVIKDGKTYVPQSFMENLK